MEQYTSITIRKSSYGEFKKAKMEREHTLGKSIKTMDFFNELIEKYKKVV